MNKKIFFFYHVFLIFLFSVLYFVIGNYIDQNQQLSYIESLSFSISTQTTVGYGKIIAKTYPMRIINIIQQLTIFGLLVLLI